jgi:hypothetical protein
MPDVRKLGGELPPNPTVNQINAYLDLCANEDIKKEIKEEVPCQIQET